MTNTKLTPRQLSELRRAAPADSGNRMRKAMDLSGVRLVDICRETDFTAPYVSDVITGRYGTITVKNAQRLAQVFGCLVDDLFPATEAVAK